MFSETKSNSVDSSKSVKNDSCSLTTIKKKKSKERVPEFRYLPSFTFLFGEPTVRKANRPGSSEQKAALDKKGTSDLNPKNPKVTNKKKEEIPLQAKKLYIQIFYK